MPVGRIFLQISPGSEQDCRIKLHQFKENASSQIGVEITDLSFYLLLGSYDYLVTFGCREFDDVGLVLLELRQHMRDEIVNTLTLLEQRVDTHKDLFDIKDKLLRCVVLVLAKPGSEQHIEDMLQNLTDIEDFTGVFGPYDYVINFKVTDLDKVSQKVREIRFLLKDHIFQTLTLFPISDLDMVT